MGLCLKLKRESLRCISPNSLKRFRNGFIGRNRRNPASLSTAAGQRRPKIRLFWQKSSLSGLLLSPASRLLSVISVLDDSRHREQDAHRDGKRFIVRVRIISKLQLCDGRVADVSTNAVEVCAGFSAVVPVPRGRNFLFFPS